MWLDRKIALQPPLVPDIFRHIRHICVILVVSDSDLPTSDGTTVKNTGSTHGGRCPPVFIRGQNNYEPDAQGEVAAGIPLDRQPPPAALSMCHVGMRYHADN